MLGDYYKTNPEVSTLVDAAVEVVRWFNNHSWCLEKLSEEQITTYQKSWALILPVITRWTSHFCSLSRLLQVNKALKLTATRHGEEFIEYGKRSTALVIRPACSQKLFQGIGSPKEHYPLCRYYYLATGPRIGQTHRAAVVNERQGRIVGCRTVVAKTCWHALCGDE